MKSKLKISIGLFLTLSLVLVLNYIFSENIMVLSIFFVSISILFFLLQGKKMFWKLGKYWLKFALFLVFVFAFFGLFKCGGLNYKCILERTEMGIITALILLNTVYAVELFILSITINDILSLNLPIKYLKFLILTRTLMTQGVAKFENDNVLFNIIPEFQIERKISFKNLKPIFFQKIILIITITFYLIEQGEILGSLIDNRINHIYKSE